MSRVKELVAFITENSDAYYSGKPSVSDAEFDEAWYELQSLDPENPILDRIGDTKFDGYEERKHQMFMHSQQKARGMKEFEGWLNKLPASHKNFRVDHKLDGLSIELIYHNGILKHALTQGPVTGFDIVNNVKKMSHVPLRWVKYDGDGGPFTGSLRGEIIMGLRIHEEKYVPMGYKITRGTAAGLSKKDGDHLSDIQVVIYDSNLGVDTHGEILDFLNTIKGAKVVESKVFSREKLLEGVREWYEALTKQRNLGMKKGGLELEIDGLVVKSDFIDPKDAAREKPKYQIAIKFPAQEKVTKVLEVWWSQSGCILTPMARLEPVMLCSTKVKSASLHNPSILEALDVRVGSTVRVSKRGDIIPKIEKVTEVGDGPKVKLMGRCPACDTKTKITKTRSKLYCPNFVCPALIPHRVAKWISTLEVKYFGEELIKAFVEKKQPTFVYELYDLKAKEMAEWTLSEKKVGMLTATKVLKNLREASIDLPLDKFLGGFDIPSIGKRVFQFAIKEGYDLKALRAADEDELAKIKGLGPKRGKFIVAGLVRLSDEINGMLDGRVTLAEIEENAEEVEIKGSVCFTGALSISRTEMEAMAKKAGFEIKTGVSRGLTFLVTPDPNSGSAKNVKAQGLGVKVIDEKKFREML